MEKGSGGLREYFNGYFTAHYAEMLEDLRVLTAFRSLEENPAEIRAALDYMLARAAEMGMRTGLARGGDSGWAEIGEGGETVGVLVHVDVVGVGDIALWRSPPFELAERDGAIFCRGAIDDKGPAIISLWAMRALMELNTPFKRKVRLIIGTSEESEWTDMRNYKAEFGEPDFGYSPDGEFPVYNIEKGYADYQLLFGEERIADIAELSAGDSPNTIPSRAVFAEKGGERLVFSGRSVHSSMPERGDNAILRLAGYAAERGYKFARFLLDFFAGDNHGIRLGLFDGADTYDNIYVGETTAAPTILKLLDGGVLLNLNIRHRFGTEKQALDAAFAAQAEKYGYSFAARDFTTPVLVPPEQEFLRLMNEIYAEYGYEGGFKVASGASYAQTMKGCVCWGPEFPGEPDTAHMENENITLDCFMTSAEIYGRYLARVAIDRGTD